MLKCINNFSLYFIYLITNIQETNILIYPSIRQCAISNALSKSELLFMRFEKRNFTPNDEPNKKGYTPPPPYMFFLTPLGDKIIKFIL